MGQNLNGVAQPVSIAGKLNVRPPWVIPYTRKNQDGEREVYPFTVHDTRGHGNRWIQNRHDEQHPFYGRINPNEKT